LADLFSFVYLPLVKKVYIDHAELLERLHGEVVCKGQEGVRVRKSSGQAVLFVLHSQGQRVYEGEV
jgi:hypothetical protein